HADRGNTGSKERCQASCQSLKIFQCDLPTTWARLNKCKKTDRPYADRESDRGGKDSPPRSSHCPYSPCFMILVTNEAKQCHPYSLGRDRHCVAEVSTILVRAGNGSG